MVVFFVVVLLWFYFFCGVGVVVFLFIAILAMQGYVSIVSYSLPFLRIFIAMPYEPICIESSRLDLASIRLESIGLERIRL